MSNPPATTSAEGLRQYLPGELLAIQSGPAWQDLLVEILLRQDSEQEVPVPAVPEPQLVWTLEGEVGVEERRLDPLARRAGRSLSDHLRRPYEVRWKATRRSPIRLMQVYVGLPLLIEASEDVLGASDPPLLQEFSSRKDPTITGLLGELRREMEGGRPARRWPSISCAPTASQTDLASDAGPD